MRHLASDHCLDCARLTTHKNAHSVCITHTARSHKIHAGHVVDAKINIFYLFHVWEKFKKNLSYKIKSWNLKKDLRSGQQETKRELWRYWSLSDESLEVLAHKLVGLLLTPQAMITGESSTLGNLICPSQMSLIKSRLILFPAWLCTPRTTYPKQDKINMLTAEIMTDFGNLWTLFAVNTAKHLSKWMGGYS